MLKIAIVGTGNISHNHIQAYLQFAPRCQIVALVDIYPEKAHEKKARYGLTDARVYASHQQMLATEPDIDIQREAELNAVFQQTPPLEWTLHTGQIHDLLQSIELVRAPRVDGEQGKRALELITAIYKSAITRAVVALPIPPDDPFYRTGGMNALAPRFYAKSASVANFNEVGAIPLGKNLDRGI